MSGASTSVTSPPSPISTRIRTSCCRASTCSTMGLAGRRREGSVAYDYRGYFGEITLTHDLTTLPGERRWTLAPPGRYAEPHQILLYLGCNVLRTSHMLPTTTTIFDRLRPDYRAVGRAPYCLRPPHHTD